MATNREVATRFVSGGRDLKSGSMYTEDGCRLLYSYGRHFILAEEVDDNSVLVNDSKYSQTTSRHQSEVAGALHRAGYTPTGEFSRGVNGHMYQLWTRG